MIGPTVPAGSAEPLNDDQVTAATWTRGLAGVKLVISEAHAGLKAAIEAVLPGASWQLRRVHFLPNVLAQVPKGHQEMAASVIRAVVAQPGAEHVRTHLGTVAGLLGRQFPTLETMLREAGGDLTAFAGFPVSHWKKIWSTNPLERVSKEIKRRTGRRYLSEASMTLLTSTGIAELTGPALLTD
jgi:putative transposase